jgi:hypothetical protein
MWCAAATAPAVVQHVVCAPSAQAEAGEACEAVSCCAGELVALCALLPAAGGALFGDAPASAAPRRRAVEVDAGGFMCIVMWFL